MAFHCFLQKFQCSLAIPPLCDERLKNLTLVIDRPPEIVNFTIDPNENLVQMPPPLRGSLLRRRTLLSDFRRKYRTEPVPPSAHSLIAYVDTPFMEQILDLPQ